MGTTKIKIFLLAVITAFIDVKEVFSDGKVTFWEGLGLVPDLKKVPDIIKIFPEVKAEFADLDEAERSEIVLFVKDELNLKDAHVELVIEEALDLATATYIKSVALIDKIKAGRKA